MAKTKSETGRRGVRWGRMFWTLIVLAVIGAGVYGASWLNARRYFLIVGQSDVHVAKGRMLPVGHEPFVPHEVELRRAYETFALPAGINVPRGETMFNERLELDQSLFRVLKDCIAFTLSRDDRGSGEIVTKYLAQIRAIPGTSVSQQIELGAIERDAAYATAGQRLDTAVLALKDAARLYRESMRGPGARAADGEARAHSIEAVLSELDAKGASQHEKPAPQTARTTTTATRAASH